MKIFKLLPLFTAAWMSSVAYSAPLRVGLVLDKGGKDDKSFNTAALQGAQKAEKELGIFLKYVEATDDNAFEPLMRTMSKGTGKLGEFDLIIGIGFAQADAIKKVSGLFPNKKFAIIDGDVTAANVKSLLFEEHEGSYLVGYLAGKATTSGKVGFVGGMDIPLIRRFAMGYEAGVKKANPKAQVVTNYIGVTGDAWNNPPKAKELALTQYASGSDTIFAAAGASNTGVFDAAESKKKFAIGVDSNQNWMKPGTILTSMLKRVDVAVFNVIKDTQKGSFKAGTERFGLKNEGVGYSLDQYNDKLISAAWKKELENVKSQIIAGKIQVPDYYKTKK